MTLPAVAELQLRTAHLLAQWRVTDTAVRVSWNRRLTTTAGRAFVRNGRIELNPTLLAHAPDQLPMVLTHEAAHIAAFRLFGPNIQAHGRHWRSLMRLAGHAPEVTHKIPLRAVRLNRRRCVYLRVCEHCGDRAIQNAVRYGRCQGCSARDSFLVMKAPATRAGRAALGRLTLAQVRAAFA
ncbi:MAG TPA: SprT-like domain-containing protein [Planctomycetota bacterium]